MDWHTIKLQVQFQLEDQKWNTTGNYTSSGSTRCRRCNLTLSRRRLQTHQAVCRWACSASSQTMSTMTCCLQFEECCRWYDCLLNQVSCACATICIICCQNRKRDSTSTICILSSRVCFLHMPACVCVRSKAWLAARQSFERTLLGHVIPHGETTPYLQ